MITLRTPNRQSSCRVILSDSLIGEIDGVNQTFSVSYEYTSGCIEIIYNGQVLTSPTDFKETGPQEITFIYLKPDDTAVIKANYEIGNCAGEAGLNLNFTGLEDTPPSYSSHAGKLVSVNESETGLSFIDFEQGVTNFITLTDTPTTYSGFENHYVKVNSAGDGLEFALPEGNTQEGISDSIPNGAYSTTVNFDRAFASDQYILTVGLENTVDPTPLVYPTLIKDKTVTAFTVEFSGNVDSDNYYLNWRATLSGIDTLGGAGINELSDDLSPELGGNLEVGDNLVMLKTTPYSTTVSGGYVRGHSGDASEMFVFDNSPSVGDGFSTPLYMRSDGKWGTCTAVSGTTQMPCAALALEPGDGGIKKILWKGIIRKGEWSWTPGDLIYVSTVQGALTKVRPSNGHRKQCVGLAIEEDTIRFDPGFNPGI